MVRPSSVLCARLRFTTKQVGRGFYRGNRTGAMGAHTEFGGYLIDWRKTAHFNVPETTGFSLTPFVTLEMPQRTRVEDHPDGGLYTPEKIDAVEFIRAWKKGNPAEYDSVAAHQERERKARLDEQMAAQLDNEPEHISMGAEENIEPHSSEAKPKE